MQQDEDKENMQIMINCVSTKAVEEKESEIERLKGNIEKSANREKMLREEIERM